MPRLSGTGWSRVSGSGSGSTEPERCPGVDVKNAIDFDRLTTSKVMSGQTRREKRAPKPKPETSLFLRVVVPDVASLVIRLLRSRWPLELRARIARRRRAARDAEPGVDGRGLPTLDLEDE